jgi:predicted nucleotide-binding protein (sugar kinase/HSP70/actin superfamily)
MKIGIPRGLLYIRYLTFAQAFVEGLGAEAVISPETDKSILDAGVRCCVDDACLPIKVFHGHVRWLRGRCGLILLPRLVGLREREFICPMFCGLPELLKNDIPGLPPLLDAPLYSLAELREWALQIGLQLTGDRDKILAALADARRRQRESAPAPGKQEFPLTVGLIGHPYNLFDRFVNMDLINKLGALGLGALTAEALSPEDIAAPAKELFKKPFWTAAAEYFGAAVSFSRLSRADGIIYLSSFSCGIDSVVTELIKSELGDFPLLILKLDEQTGEAGLETRLEAFADLLRARANPARAASASRSGNSPGLDIV